MDDTGVSECILSFVGGVVDFVFFVARVTERKQVHTKVARCRCEHEHACGLWPGGGVPDGGQLLRDGRECVVASPPRAVRDTKVH
jgi:hypothetical protein